MIREILKMLNQYAVDYPTFPVSQRCSHHIVIRLLSRNDKPPDIWDTHGISRNVFVNPPASSSSPYPGGFNPWISKVTEDTSPHVTSERQNPNTTLRREVFQRIMGLTNKDCRFRIFTLTNSLLQQHLLAGR